MQKIKAAIFFHYGGLVCKAGDFILHLQLKDVVLFISPSSVLVFLLPGVSK